jgi:plasmid replication initiation protein
MTDKKQVLKSKTKKVYKHNKLNRANFSDFNLNDYRVYLNTIALLGGVDEKGKYLQPENLPREYTLSAKEFSQQFNIELKHAYTILKSSIDKLRKTDIKIEHQDMFTTTYINVCEKVEYKHKEGTITVLFTGSIMDYLRQKTKNFTLYNLKEIAELTSLYAVRIYELIQQHSTSGYIIFNVESDTANPYKACWRDILGIVPGQYKKYSHLKEKVFAQAIKEINTKTTYNLTMTEEKEGKKVIRVRLDFEPDTIHVGYDKDGVRRTRHIKPKKQKSEALKNNNPDVHPSQQELDLK